MDLTPAPTRDGHCPDGYGDYGTRFDWGLGRVTIVMTHGECGSRCTRFAGPQYSGGCKAYMTGMYYGMLFCRSYGGNYRTTMCAPWAVPDSRGFVSGPLGSTHPNTGQKNVGGNCCTNTSVLA